MYKVGEGGVCFRCRNNSSFRLKSLGPVRLRQCLLVAIGSGGRTKESKTGAEQQCQCGVKRENKQEDYIVGGNETTVSSPSSFFTFTALRMALNCRLLSLFLSLSFVIFYFSSLENGPGLSSSAAAQTEAGWAIALDL